MNVKIFAQADQADAAAASTLVRWLELPETRTVMVASGNTPLELYRHVAERGLNLSHLKVFALDEYVGAPLDDPRTCGNFLRRTVAQAWRIPDNQFFTISSLETDALSSVLSHERQIEAAGGIDVIVLGLGQNGHLGFNEPGSARDSAARLVELAPISVEANRKWFNGAYAPAKGATVGLKTILSARHVLLAAYGQHKAAAAKTMIEGPIDNRCPASFLQEHAQTEVFLDELAAAGLTRRT